MKVAVLDVGNSIYLGLIEYIKSGVEPRFSEGRVIISGGHIGFDVEDINATAEDLLSMGVRILNNPAAIVSGRNSCFLQDPDGNGLQFVEDLNE